MNSALKVSEAAGLAIHAASLLGRSKQDGPVKLSRLAKQLNASQAHLSKVMHRLVQAGVATSKRGPTGGFFLGPRADDMTMLDLYEMFDGPIGHHHCLMGLSRCPMGGCVLGDAISTANTLLRETLESTPIVQSGHKPANERGRPAALPIETDTDHKRSER